MIISVANFQYGLLGNIPSLSYDDDESDEEHKEFTTIQPSFQPTFTHDMLNEVVVIQSSTENNESDDEMNELPSASSSRPTRSNVSSVNSSRRNSIDDSIQTQKILTIVINQKPNNDVEKNDTKNNQSQPTQQQKLAHYLQYFSKQNATPLKSLISKHIQRMKQQPDLNQEGDQQLNETNFPVDQSISPSSPLLDSFPSTQRLLSSEYGNDENENENDDDQNDNQYSQENSNSDYSSSQSQQENDETAEGIKNDQQGNQSKNRIKKRRVRRKKSRRHKRIHSHQQSNYFSPTRISPTQTVNSPLNNSVSINWPSLKKSITIAEHKQNSMQRGQLHNRQISSPLRTISSPSSHPPHHHHRTQSYDPSAYSITSPRSVSYGSDSTVRNKFSSMMKPSDHRIQSIEISDTSINNLQGEASNEKHQIDQNQSVTKAGRKQKYKKLQQRQQQSTDDQQVRYTRTPHNSLLEDCAFLFVSNLIVFLLC